MKRYTQHIVLRLQGERDLAMQYVSEGRKLLGYLTEQRAASGIKTCAIQRRYADDTVVINASYAGDTPIVEINAIRKAGEKDLPMLEGFVVWPEGGDWTAFRDFPELVLVPRKGGSYTVVSYDGSELPEGLATRKYQPVFPTVGLKQAGNVDWTNASETLSVTWYGPRTRYLEPPGMAIRFTYGFTRNQWLFIHGQEVVDVWAEPYVTLLDGIEWGEVEGAAIRRTVNGLVLIFLVTYEEEFSTQWHDTVFAVDLVGSAQTPLITANHDTARIIGTRAYGADEVDHYQHPFFFNSDASEARCIRTEGANDRRVELIVTITEDEDGELTAAFGANYHAYPTTTSASTVNGTVANVVDFRTLDHTDVDFTASSTEGVPNTYTVNANISTTRPVYVMPLSGSNTSQVYTASTMTGTVTTDHDMVQAVDYRPDGTVVYLWEVPQTSSSSGSASGSYVINGGDAEFSISSISDGDAVSPGGHLNGLKASVSGSLTADTTTSMTWTNAQTTSRGMRYGDTLEDGDVYNALVSGSLNETQTGSATGLLDDSFSHSWDGSLGAVPTSPGDDIPLYYGQLIHDGSDTTANLALQAAPDKDTAAIDRTLTLNASCSRTAVTESIVFLYADLRRDCVVYIRERETETITGSYIDSYNDTDLDNYLASQKIHSIPASSSVVRTNTVLVLQRGVVLFEHAYTSSTINSTPTNSYTQKFPSGTQAGFFDAVGYSPVVDTLTPLPDMIFNTDGFSFAQTGVFSGGTSDFQRLTVFPNYPEATGFTPPPEDPIGSSPTSDSQVNHTTDTLWGQIAVGTKVGWPLSSTPEDGKSWQGHGSIAFYKDRYCFSLPTPATNFGAGWTTLAKTTDAQTLLEAHTTMHPIWVLPKVNHPI